MDDLLLAVCALFASGSVYAEPMTKHTASSILAPFGLSWVEYMWVIAISSWGGVVSWVSKMRSHQQFSLIELIGEITTSAFSGILVFLACQSTNLDGTITACLVGVSGHMGARTMYVLERGLGRILERIFGGVIIYDDVNNPPRVPDRNTRPDDTQ